MKKTGLVLVILGSLLIQSKAQTKPLVFATYTYANNDRIQNIEPLANYLSQKTGFNIKAVSYPTVQALINAIRNDSVDFAVLNTSGYLVLQRNFPGIIAPLVNLDMGNSSFTNYGGCLIASRQSPIKTIKDIRDNKPNLSLTLVNSSSTSGNLVPRLLLNKEGIQDVEARMQVNYAGTHKKVVEDILNDRATIGGCGCAEIDSARLHLDFDRKAIVIDSFNNIPLGPVAYNIKADPAVVLRIAGLLTTIHQDNYDVFSNFCKGWTEFKQATRFRKINDDEYNDFRNLFGNNSKLWKLIE